MAFEWANELHLPAPFCHGGWRISFDLTEENGQFITELAKLKHQGLYIVVVTEETLENE